MPLGLPRSVCGICHDNRNTPFEENFCTRPVMSTTYRLSCASTATERGLLSWPTPTPRDPMICTDRNRWLCSGAWFEGALGVQPLKRSVTTQAARAVLRVACCVGAEHAPRTTHHARQTTTGATATASSVRQS